jgi:quercetin dioxygenase-like cupin family protein
MNAPDGGVFLMPGEGREIALGDRGAVATLKAAGGDTGGRFAVVETAPQPGAPGLAMHRHQKTDEALYVLEGTVVVRAGVRVQCAPAGAFVVIPRGAAHMFWNPGPGPARVLVLFVPAGVERFLEETAAAFAAAKGAPDPARLAAIRARHDTEMVEQEPPNCDILRPRDEGGPW